MHTARISFLTSIALFGLASLASSPTYEIKCASVDADAKPFYRFDFVVNPDTDRGTEASGEYVALPAYGAEPLVAPATVGARWYARSASVDGSRIAASWTNGNALKLSKSEAVRWNGTVDFVAAGGDAVRESVDCTVRAEFSL